VRTDLAGWVGVTLMSGALSYVHLWSDGIFVAGGLISGLVELSVIPAVNDYFDHI